MMSVCHAFDCKIVLFKFNELSTQFHFYEDIIEQLKDAILYKHNFHNLIEKFLIIRINAFEMN